MPATCILCRRPAGREFDLCPACQARLGELPCPCRTCALPLPPDGGPLCGQCLGTQPLIQRTVAALAYGAPVSELITAFKYHGALQHGRVLSQLLVACLRQAYGKKPLPELLLPVPLHTARLRERGFNQALVIATHLGKALHIPIAPDMLLRTRVTPPQQGLNAAERKRNLRGAFALRPGLDPEPYRRIALIDDVVTTMSTVRELARLLHEANSGQAEIHVWCLARA